MERSVIFHQDQQVTHSDLSRIGTFARRSFDHVVHDGIEHARKYWGFPVTETGPLEVTVGAGRLYNTGKVFYREDDGGVTLSLADFVPIVTRRIVAIAVWGNEIETAVEPRTFLIDIDTMETEAQAVATESRRHAEINAVAGTEAVEPQPPALDANVLAIAYVTMTPGGIEKIEAVEANRIASVTTNRQKINALEAWRLQAGARIDTLASDLAGLAARQRGLVNEDMFFEVTADVARLKDLSGLPDDMSSFAADHFLDLSGSDDEHPDWLARIEEGIRFPAAQSHLAQLALLNQFEDRVKVTDGFMLPKYTSQTRLGVVGNDGELSISQYQHQTIEIVEKTRTRERVRYGPVFRRCSNANWWRSGTFDPLTGIFTRGDEQYQAVDNQGNPIVSTRRGVRLRRIWIDTWEESYTEAKTVTVGLAGSVIGQTFLTAQDGWLTGLRLYFTQAAETGNVHVMITETTAGAPDLDKVIARVTVDAEDLRIYPQATQVPIGPVHLDQGRYAVVLMTPGNHFVSTVSGNKFLEGSLFQSTDAMWFMGDLVNDMAVEFQFAEFQSPRVEVQMEPLTLENGIANIDLLTESIVPSGTELHYEVQIDSVWRRLGEVEGLLNGLPALLPFRIVFLGTTDNHAGIALGAPSTALTWRPRSDFKHVSATRTPPDDVDTVEVRTVVEWWDTDRHTIAVKLLTGAEFATEHTPDVTEIRALDDLMEIEGRREIRTTFNLTPAVSAYKIAIEGDTNNVLVTYHVARRTDIAWAAD